MNLLCALQEVVARIIDSSDIDRGSRPCWCVSRRISCETCFRCSQFSILKDITLDTVCVCSEYTAERDCDIARGAIRA